METFIIQISSWMISWYWMVSNQRTYLNFMFSITYFLETFQMFISFFILTFFHIYFLFFIISFLFLQELMWYVLARTVSKIWGLSPNFVDFCCNRIIYFPLKARWGWGVFQLKHHTSNKCMDYLTILTVMLTTCG